LPIDTSQYLLVRPYPSLRILFCSPSLRVPGILQSRFLSRIGGSPRVREELTTALTEGRGVTAKVRWISGRYGDEGRVRWIHCTPLLGHNGALGVWMVVLVDDDASAPVRRFRPAPPVAADIATSRPRPHDPETDSTHLVNAIHVSDRPNDYAKQTAAPAKYSKRSYARHRFSADGTIRSHSSMARPSSSLTASSIHSFGLD